MGPNANDAIDAKPRKRFATMSDNGNLNDLFENIEDEDDNANVGCIGLSRKIRNRSSYVKSASTQLNLDSTRPVSPWSAMGRFLNKWSNLRKTFRKRRNNSDSRVVISSTFENSNDNILSIDQVKMGRSLGENVFVKESVKQCDAGLHYKVVSKTAGDQCYTIALDTSNTAEVCKEFMSRLTCYDVMPQSTDIIAIDSQMPFNKVLHILRLRQRSVAALLWDSANNAIIGLCDIVQLVASWWQKQTNEMPDLVNHAKEPVGNYFTAGFQGVSAEMKLTEATFLFCPGLRRKKCFSKMDDKNIGTRRSLFLPLLNDENGDVVGAMSAVDVLKFFCKQICKFDLVSVFDSILISQHQSRLASAQTHDSLPLASTSSIGDALTRLVKSDCGVLPVMKSTDSVFSLSFETIVSIVDVVDFIMRQRGCWNEKNLSKSLNELLMKMPKKNLKVYNLHTPLSLVIRNLATSRITQTDSVLPIAIITDDAGNFMKFLQAEDILQAILSVNEIAYDQNNFSRNDSGVDVDLEEDLDAVFD